MNSTESGLQFRVLTQGEGAIPARTDRVRVHYTGKLIDGTVFDSSVARGEPAEFPVNGVIAGWIEALTLMPVGSKWELTIPQELAYGERGAGASIPPFSTRCLKWNCWKFCKRPGLPDDGVNALSGNPDFSRCQYFILQMASLRVFL